MQPSLLQNLDAAYKGLQRQLHPDKFATKSAEERDISTSNSTIVNTGNIILRSNVQRAGYMLALNQYKNPLDEDVKADDPELLMQIFGFREEIEDAVGQKDELQGVREQVGSEIGQVEEDLEMSFQEKDFEKAQDLTVKLIYYGKVLTEVQEKIDELPSEAD
jgi:molecular chaperone HscB